MKKVSFIFSMVLLILFIGCGGSGSSNESFSPSVTTNNITYQEDSSGYVTQIAGEISFSESNTNFNNVQFSSVSASVDGCTVDSMAVVPSTLTNQQTGTFTITLADGCKKKDSYLVEFKGNERGEYVDTNVKIQTSTFTLQNTITLPASTSPSTPTSPTTDINKDVGRIVVLQKYVKITQPNQTQEFKIITLDENNRPISADVSMNVLIDENDNTYGTLDNYYITTDTITGEGVVNYTAPSDLDNLEGNYTINFQVVNTVLETNATLDFTKEEEDTNATEYVIQLVTPNSFIVNSKDSFTVKIVKKADNEVYIDSKDVHDVNLSFINNMVAFNADRDKYTYEYNQSASKSIDIYSKKYSGIDFVDINASIFDGEKNVTLSQRFNVVLISGPISAISINYLDTIYDADTGLFIEKYAVHAVDRYSNPANAGSKIYVGAINGMKIKKDKNGTIGYNSSDEVTEFNVTDVNLTASDIKEDDILAILASSDRLDSVYLGGWSIKEVVADDKLKFNEKYSGEVTDLLTYVIGNEKRYDGCSESIRLIDFNSTDGTYEIGSNGIAYISAKYDPFLVGKTVTFYANSNSDKRVGVAIKKILFGTGINNPGSLACEAGDENEICDLIFGIDLKDSSEQLENTLLKGTFIRTDKNGECNITYESDYTNCSGAYTVRVSVEKNSTCNVEWSGAVDYEY